MALIGVYNIKHGQRHSITYSSWSAMKTRCYNEKYDNYPNYGGRGITVCDRWLNSFDAFLEDMGERPSIKHTLDRHPDNDGNYEPNNCRWATRKEQLRNTRINLWLESSGIKMVVTDWELRWDIPKNAIQGHIRRGKSFDEIFEFYETGKNMVYNKK